MLDEEADDRAADPRFHEGSLFADLEFHNKKRKTHREMFLERMEGLIPWQRLEECASLADSGGEFEDAQPTR